jgi:GNAT superfamily N-acetyltransferase
MQQVSLRDTRGSADDRRWIAGVYRDYMNDLAPEATGLFPALGEFGHREPDQLQRWFDDRSAQVLTILYDVQQAGFAMVRRRLIAAASPATAAGPATGTGTAPAATRASEFTMAEFFISRPWRRRGIGSQAVRLLFDRFAGQWLITEHVRNGIAVKFWRGVVSAYTQGNYQERIVNGEVQQHFVSGVTKR